MGNQLAGMAKGFSAKGKKKKSFSQRGKSKDSLKKASVEEELIQQQALALALQQHQKAQMRLERSMSQRNTPGQAAAPSKLPRSASTRPRSVTDPVVHPQQLLNGSLDDKVIAKLQTKHFLLVHGGGHGAWCWYKTMALLQEAGFTASAVDLLGSGIDFTDPNKITSLAQYTRPLSQFLDKLGEDEQVIIVGHNMGGVCISYAMEHHSKKIAMAIFVAAAMVINGQRAFDVFAPQAGTENNMLKNAQRFNYANGGNTPTSVEVDKNLIKDVFYNQSPAKDVALATVSVRPVPFAPLMEKVVLTSENYGSIRRFFIGTTDDNALPLANQEALIQANPPEKYFKVKGSDHAPFLSRPQAFHKNLIEIATLGGNR